MIIESYMAIIIAKTIVLSNFYVDTGLQITNTNTPGVVLSQCDSDTADTMAGLHVSILNSLSELLLEGQHLRNQFQQSVHISIPHGHINRQRNTRIDC